MPPQPNIDEKALNLAKAIKKAETGDSPDAYQQHGASGEFGAYQFMPDTYKDYAKRYLGNANADPSVENQNKIAYSFVKEKKDAGFTPAQIASMWNAGEKKPNAYREGWVGTNDQGVQYDTPGYVSRVSQRYLELTGGTPTAQAGGYVTPPEVAPPLESPEAAPEEPKKGLLSRIGSALIGNEKNFGESIAGAILPFTGAQTQFEEAQAQEQKAGDEFVSIVLNRKRAKQARGEDTSKEDEQLRNFGVGDKLQYKDFNPASEKNAKQIAGEAIGVGADVLSAGAFGKAAQSAKTGVLGKAVGPTLTAPVTRSQGIIRGAGQGIAAGGGFGAVQGGARAMQEDKDLGGIVTDTLIGGAAGGALGGVLGAGAGAVKGVRGVTNKDEIIKRRYDELANIQKNNAVVRRVIEAGDKRGIDTKKILSENDFLVGAVDKDGTIDTTNALAEMQDFLEPIEGTVRKNLERDAKKVTLEEVRKHLVSAVRGSGIKGAALRRALNNVDDDIAGYALEAGPDGTIPLTLLHDAKVDKYRNLNYLNPESSRIDKTIAKGLKTFVQDNTESIDVGKINKELSDYYATMSVLEKLNGKKVKAGRLGKYFAQTVGSIVGSHFGPLGAIVGAELGGDILGKSMASKFGPKIGSIMEASPELRAAAELADKPPVRRLNVQDLGTDYTDVLPTIDAGENAVSKYKRDTGLPVVEDAPKVYADEPIVAPYVDPRRLPTIKAGAAPKTSALPVAEGAPNVYVPERQSTSSKSRGSRKANQSKVSTPAKSSKGSRATALKNKSK